MALATFTFVLRVEVQTGETADVENQQDGDDHEDTDSQGDDGIVYCERVEQTDDVVSHHLGLEPRLSPTVVL